MQTTTSHRHLPLLLVVTILLGCFTSDPWELNVAFWLQDNQAMTDSVRIGGKQGRFVIATGSSRTVIDATFAGVPPGSTLGAQDLLIGGRKRTPVKPAVLDLKKMADGLLGTDAWRGSILTLDYRRGLATIGGVADRSTDGANIHSYRGLPSIMIRVDGRPLRVIVDTAVPDTLIVPASFFPKIVAPRRIVTGIEMAGIRFNETSILVSGTSEARIGNRLLAHFLVTIDDSAGNVTLRVQ